MKDTNSAEHLTDDQFSGAMLGEPLSAEARMHVGECAGCREELEGFGVAMGEFRSAARDWSERRSERMPAIRTGAARGGALGGFAPAYAWAAAGLLLATGVTVPMVEHARHGREAAVAVSDDDASGMNSPEQIARDNELLAEVHAELTRVDLPGSSSATQAGRVGRRP